MDKAKNVLFLFYLLCITGVQAQISGKVADATDGSALEYATAALYRQADSSLVTGVISDGEGFFEIGAVGPGTYFLELSFLGYETRLIPGIRQDNPPGPVDLGVVPLTLAAQQLGEVEVAGQRPVMINRIDRQVFDTGNFQNSRGGSATDVIRNIPSVTVDGLGEINVRGTTGFVVLLNGNPIQGNAANLLNQLPANAIRRVEVITAPSARYDPEGKAGIINILTTKEMAEGAYTQINVRGGFPSVERYGNAELHQRYGVDATYNIRRGDWNISLGGSYQRSDRGGRREGDVFTILDDTLTRFPSDGERSFDEVNYSGRLTLDYAPDSTNSYSLGFYAGKRSQDRTADILYYDNHAITPADGGERVYTFQYFNENLRTRRGDFVLGSLDFAHSFRNASRLSASLLYEYTLLGGPTTNRNLGYPDTEIIYQDEYNTNDNPLNGVRFQLDYAFAPLKAGKLETGYQYRLLDHRGDFVYERRNNTTGAFELVPEFSSEADLRRHLHSGYLQLSGEKDSWEYAAGARMEFMDREFDLRDKTGTVDTTYVYDYFKLFPSASVQYSFNDRTRLKAAYSKRVERTTTFKMNPFPEREHSETLEQGDPTLRPEFIDLFELGINRNFKGGHSVYSTAYFRNVKNLVNRVNTVYNDTILNRIYSNVGNAKALGLEVGIQIKPTPKWSNFIGFNMYDYSIDGRFDDREVENNAFVYSINANSTLDLSENTSVQFTFNYLSASNTAQGEDSRFYSPNLTFRKSFFDNRLTATLQWQHMDLGLLKTNEQRITTFRPGEFFTTTNYVYEVDIILLNLTYTINSNRDKSRFIESEFGKREF